MQVKRFEVNELFGRSGKVVAELNEDLNIITGRNGAGKTTLLKLMWYVMSGNIFFALQEVPFARCRLITDSYDCIVHRLGPVTCKVDFESGGKKYVFEDTYDESNDLIRNAEDDANSELMERGSSIFLPTFRRIEGGFTLTSKRGGRCIFSGGSVARQRSDIEDALIDLARRLTNKRHIFVSSISTSDIVTLLLRRFADYSQEYNDLQERTSNEIITTIKEYKYDQESQFQLFDTSDKLLDVIRSKIEAMEGQRGEIMAPMDTVRSTVERLISHTGIRIDTRLGFGDSANAVNSDLLSAGEKQMLSFICYNAFYRDCVVLIDEPELSLHVDWQRQLFPTLLGQKSSNQFIVATHSPFIYSKYPDKEVPVNVDRGDSSERLVK
jgi:predicted ATPase